ncbi:MAG: hypothetical protein IKL08_04395, partial [Clostridia bacterium]|nr:hypothetical protein [Clostridia bacterium]
ITKETNSLVVMCHEAVHSIQNKALHILNSIFSNISVILGLVCIVLFVVKRTNLVLSIITLVSLIMSIITRLVLEVEAVNKSVILAKEIVLQDVVNNVKLEELTNAKEYINKNKIIALLNMVIGKIVLFLIVLLIMII